MAKKKWGKLLVAAILLGTAIAGGIAYLTRYRNTSDTLDDDFDDFDDDFDDDFTLDDSEENSKREYVPLDLEASDKEGDSKATTADPKSTK